MSDTFPITTIARVHSPYRQKFGIPRQPRLAQSITTRIELLPGFNRPEIIRGLEQCSHIWLLFIFSATADQGWKPTVQPPRMGKKRFGVFATRSPFRPNPIGMSAVKLERIEQHKGKLCLVVSGADLLDGTPVIDIKPYLPYADRIEDAQFGLVDSLGELSQPVIFTPEADQQCQQQQQALNLPLHQQITELLRCDPRPVYDRQDADRVFGVQLHELNIRFRIGADEIQVLEVAPIQQEVR